MICVACNRPASNCAGIVFDEQGLGMKQGRIGILAVIDAQGDIVQPQSFKDGKIGLADMHLPAEQFRQICPRHRPHAVGIGQISIAEDDRAEKQQQRQHPPAPHG